MPIPPASPTNGVVKPTVIRIRMLKMYGRSSGFILRKPDEMLILGYLLDPGRLPCSVPLTLIGPVDLLLGILPELSFQGVDIHSEYHTNDCLERLRSAFVVEP